MRTTSYTVNQVRVEPKTTKERVKEELSWDWNTLERLDLKDYLQKGIRTQVNQMVKPIKLQCTDENNREINQQEMESDIWQ